MMQCFCGVLKCVAQMCAPTRKSCGFAAASSVLSYDTAALESAGIGSDIGATVGKSHSVFDLPLWN